MSAFTSLIIRADVTAEIGTGHLLRCLALAQAWHGRVLFLSYCESSFLKKRVKEEGFKILPVKTMHPDPADIEETLKFLKAGSYQWVLLDGPHFDSKYQETIRDNGYRLIVVDDLNNYSFYHADILVNQNFMAERIEYKCSPDTVQLLGANWIMLRRDFLTYKKPEVHERRSDLKRILVTFGGSDPLNLTQSAIRVIGGIGGSGIEARVVVGPANNRLNVYRDLLSGCSCAVEFLADVIDMPGLFDWADLAIICGGTTLWECLYMGCSVISFACNDTQHSLLSAMHKQGVIYYAGRAQDTHEGDLEKVLRQLLDNEEKQCHMRASGRKFVDGKGTSRLVEVVEKLEKSNSIQTSKKYSMITDPEYGFLRIDPVPTQEEVERFYKEEFYSGQFQSFNDSSKEVQLADREFYEGRWEAIHSNIVRLLGRSDNICLFDVGCGFGLCMQYFKNKGMIVAGLDPAPEAVEYARTKDLQVYLAGIEDFGCVNGRRFDVVTLINVLEHLCQPAVTLRNIKSLLLKEKGLLIIDSPNDFNDFQVVAGSEFGLDQWWVCPPNHINYFSAGSLANLLERCGYRVVYKEASFPLELFMLTGEMYVGNRELGKKVHKKRVQFERLMRTHGKARKLSQFYSALAECDLGRQVVMYAFEGG